MNLNVHLVCGFFDTFYYVLSPFGHICFLIPVLVIRFAFYIKKYFFYLYLPPNCGKYLISKAHSGMEFRKLMS